MARNRRHVFMENTLKKYCAYDTPIGRLVISGEKGKVEQLLFPLEALNFEPDSAWEYDRTCFKEILSQLDDYFAGKRKTFSLNLHPIGTEFQKKVWSELEKIPYGETINYGELAKRIGNPKASRAVGAANGKNPIPIVIPCHRVIGKNGSLTGFGGGLDIKKQLLDLEEEHR